MNTPAPRGHRPPSRVVRLAVVLYLLPALGCLVTVAGGWPGGVSPDAYSSIREGLLLYFQGHQEPLWALVWTVATRLAPVPVAVKSTFVLQAIAYWLAFGIFVRAALKRHSPVAAILAAFAGFLPPLLDYAVMVESNIHVGIAWMLAVAIAYTWQGPSVRRLCLVLCFYGFIARSGMIVVVGPVLFAVLLLSDRTLTLRRAGIRAAVYAASFFFVSTLATTILVGTPNRQHVLSISELFDIAGVYQDTHTHCIPPAMVPASTTAEAIMAEYDPTLVTSVIWRNSKGGFILPKADADFARLRACWLRTVRDHPREYLAVKRRFAALFLMIGMDLAPAVLPDYSMNAELGLSVPNNAVTKTMAEYIEGSRQMYVWKGWVWVVIGAIVALVAVVVRLPEVAVVGALYFASLGALTPHFVAGQGVLARYFFLPYMLCLAELLVFANSVVDTIDTKRALRSGVSRYADR